MKFYGVTKPQNPWSLIPKQLTNLNPIIPKPSSLNPHPLILPSQNKENPASEELQGLSPDFGEHSGDSQTSFRGYLGGQGDLVSGLIRGITGVTIWVIGLLTYLLSPRDPPSMV